MLETILNIDLWLFHLLNKGIANPIFDFVMPIVTNQKIFLPVYLIGLVLLIWKGGKRGRIAALILILTVIASDYLSSQVIKSYVGRLRPCHTLLDVRLLVGCGPGKSFPSSHAVNNFAMATILAYFYRKYQWYFWSFASIVAFSRVYVGVHYPLDIFGGALVGFVVGMIFILICRLIEKKMDVKVD
jgi:undecaprenyl-diphosphatase